MRHSKIDIYRPEETGALVFGLDETGTVVSVFDKAINIRISNRRLVSIVRHAQAMTPMSILCPALLDREGIIRSGRTVHVRGGVLAAHDWCMEIAGSKRFEGIPVAGQPLDLDANRMDRFEKVLHFAGQKDGLLGITRAGEPQNLFVRKGREIAEEILSCDSGHFGTQLAALVGLGPGFTPSGDDLICGFLMGDALGCQSLGATPGAHAPILDQHQKAILYQAADNTSDAGRTLIRMALQGRFPRFLCRVADQLRRAETFEEMLAMVTEANRYGHTSGTDALTGLLLYWKTRRQHLMGNGGRNYAPPLARPTHISFTG